MVVMRKAHTNKKYLRDDVNDGKISILMGIYNCEETLDEAILSIIKQTYKNWELIMCDDCSVDGTYNIAKKYVELYQGKFVLIKNERNMGLNVTLNRCLELASGDFIGRMDGDDISLPTRFEEEMKIFEKYPDISVVSTQMLYFDAKGIFGRSTQEGYVVKEQFPMGSPFCHAPCLVKKEAYDAVGGYSVSKRLLRMEDYHLWIKMYEKGYIGYNVGKPLYKMRDDRNAIKRRKYCFRINEAYVIGIAVRKLKLKKRYYIYAFRPLIVGLLPIPLYSYLHRKRLGNT